ncbi:caspase family protein [Streptomyces sp. NPDC001315]|uniref:caspase family protein n=1 Tax=Streptomyces sp. NPDC001315 TaxID=3364562 RepID=UPI003695CC6D
MSTELSGVTPERTRAILVGVERYDQGPFHDLPGPARDALAHAQWLRDNGVPPDNIRLCVSPLDHNREHTRTTARHLGLTLHDATHDVVKRILVDELPDWEGDLLWFAWSGHGAITSGTPRQLLIHAGGEPYKEVALCTDNLQNALLHSPPYQRIPHKVLCLDACRNHVETLEAFAQTQLPTRPPATTDTRLLVLHATQDGDLAQGDEQGGVFTRALLTELRTTDTPWPPDPRRLLETVRERMADDGERQIPWIDARTWDGDLLHHAGYRSRTRPAWLLPSDAILRRLGDRGTYLKDEVLPYIAPEDPQHPARPENLLARLDDPRRGRLGTPGCGVLLTGIAGAGKTRTCIEVAALADRSGWQVLHVDRAVGLTARTLAAEIQEELKDRGDQRLLLLLDYLDQYDSLDLRELADLLHAERSEGARIACLASVRPGAVGEVRKHGSLTLFEEVELAQSETHQRTIAASIFETVAPNSLAAWGPDKMATICGTRPILALLFALALEGSVDQAPNGTHPAAPAPGQLVDWLVRRTRRDIESAAGGASDSTVLHASALAVLACPQQRATVEEVVDHYLSTRPPHDHSGESIVDNLEALGWLVPTAEGPGTVDTIHDIVTDKLLDQSCLPTPYDPLNTSVLRSFLEALLGSPHTFRRAVNHLTRWSHEHNDRVQKKLTSTIGAWLATRAADVLALLLPTPAEGMRTLVSMISAPPWQQGVIDTWDSLAAPWIAHTTKPALVRAFLADAIRNSHHPVPGVLIDHALTWLDQHVTTDLDALQLIDTVRRTDDLPTHHADHLESLTLRWLDAHGTAPEARYALQTLLPPGAHTPAVTREATPVAITLAHRLRTDLETERLISTLLRTTDTTATDPEQWSTLFTAARDWLTKYGTRERATFMLAAALRRPEAPVRSSLVEHIARYALAWLGYHRRKEAAGFVLKGVLTRNGFSTKMDNQAVKDALAWLARHGTTQQASFVLGPLFLLLRKLGPGADQADIDSVVHHALTWLDRNPTDHDGDFVLRNMLRWRGLSTTQHDEQTILRKATAHAIDWLETYGTTADNSVLLTALLDREDKLTDDQKDRATTVALHRLDADPEHQRDDHRHIIRELIRANTLPTRVSRAALHHATTWLTANGTNLDASLVLAPYLYRARFTDDSDPAMTFGADLALRWLRTHGRTPNAFFVLRNLFFYWTVPVEGIDGATIKAGTVDFVLDWLKDPEAHDRDPENPESTDSDVPTDRGTDSGGAPIQAQTLIRLLLLFGQHTNSEQAERIITAALEWFRERGLTGTADDNPLRHLHRLPPLTPQTEKNLGRYALSTLPDRPDPEDTLILNPLLSRLRSAAEPDPRVLYRTLRWLRTHGLSPNATYILCHLLELEHLPEKTKGPALTHAIDWLRRHAALQDAAYVFGPLLHRMTVDDMPDDGTVRQALDWLAPHGLSEPAWRVLSRLALYPQAAAHADTVQTLATAWITAHPDAPDKHERLTQRVQCQP